MLLAVVLLLPTHVPVAHVTLPDLKTNTISAHEIVPALPKPVGCTAAQPRQAEAVVLTLVVKLREVAETVLTHAQEVLAPQGATLEVVMGLALVAVGLITGAVAVVVITAVAQALVVVAATAVAVEVVGAVVVTDAVAVEAVEVVAALQEAADLVVEAIN